MSVVRIASKILRSIRTPFELSRFKKNNPDSSLYISIKSAIRKNFTESERAWIKKIEYKRSRLLNSEDTIKIDFRLNSDPEPENNNREKIKDVCLASVNSSYGALMHRLVREFAPRNCLELGTCLGISTAFISSAITLNGAGRLVTLEGSPARSKYAESVLSELGLPDIDHVVGPFNQTLEPLLQDYQEIDFCYIDGHHNGTATIKYFESISSVLADGSIVVIDDITWSDDMNRAWNTIRDKEEVALTVDTYMMGICLIRKNKEGTLKEKTGKQSFRIMYW